ncbi:alpha/beta hydrolase [Schaalia sp. ZJ1691]|uniref:alpha/beta hydrolase n=1 Tax=Schaalia sp. ZJ1691 TaxID=2709404 RepID=UPI0013EB5E9C|nr:alpha/beta hydrolase [Schaalia sp. ZJ1691]
MNSRRSLRLAIGVAVIAVLVVVAIVSTLIWQGFLATDQGKAPGAGETDHPADPAQAKTITATRVEDFYKQPVAWHSCTAQQVTSMEEQAPRDLDQYECAALTAPKDWDDPAGEQLSLSVAVHRSGKEDAPALFFNLGGPGGAAVSSIVQQVTSSMGEALVKNYDIVALDPRGVGASTPVVCMTDEERDAYNSGDSDEAIDKDSESPDEIVKKAAIEAKKIAQGCETHSGDIYKHIDTVSAAKDFDMTRALLGEETLNYLGYSYGTFLGATYAGLFPERVGRFVLDGALDPAVDINTLSDLQMTGFEASIGHWVQDCLAGGTCPLKGTAEQGITQVSRFLKRLETAPLPTSDEERPLTQSLALTAVIGTLYSTQSYSVLTQALDQAMNDNDGSMLLYLADLFNERNADGTYASASTDALIAINNLDYSPSGTVDEWAASAEKIRKKLRVFGEFAGYASAGLSAWPTDHAARAKITADGAAPIVVIGTTHDPATPYVMAQSLAEQLSSGVLVTNEGWNHTSYSKSANACVVKAVENYFVHGSIPEDGLVCSD